MRRLNRFHGSDTGPTGISFSRSPSIQSNRFGPAPRTASSASDSPMSSTSPPAQENGQTEIHNALLDLSNNVAEGARSAGRPSGTPPRNDTSNDSPNQESSRASFEGTNQGAPSFSLTSESKKVSDRRSSASSWREGKNSLSASAAALQSHFGSRTPPARPVMPFLNGLRPEDMAVSQSSSPRREVKSGPQTTISSNNPDFSPGEVRHSTGLPTVRNDSNKSLSHGEKERFQDSSEKPKKTNSNVNVFRRMGASKPSNDVSKENPGSTVNALGVAHDKEVSLMSVPDIETEDRSHLADYAVGQALRHTVLLDVLKNARSLKSPDLASMVIELGNYFRGEYVLLHRVKNDRREEGHGRELVAGRKEKENEEIKPVAGNDDALVSAFMDNISARTSQVLHSWYHDTIQEGGGDSYLPSFNSKRSEEWVERCIAAARGSVDKKKVGVGARKKNGPRLINCEVIRLTATFPEEKGNKGVPELHKGEKGQSHEDSKSRTKEVLLGVAFVERNSKDQLVTKEVSESEENDHTDEGALSGEPSRSKEQDPKMCFTRIHSMRIAPWCNPQVWDRYKWCSKVVTGRKDDLESHAFSCAADPLDILSAMFHQVLHRSLLYGSKGVSVHCPKEAFFEEFYRKEMGRPVGRDDDGCYMFCLGGKERLNAIRKGFEQHVSRTITQKEGGEAMSPAKKVEKPQTKPEKTEFPAGKDGVKKEKLEHRVSEDTNMLQGQRRSLEMSEQGPEEESMRKRMRYDDSERHSVDTDRFDDGEEPEVDFRGVEASEDGRKGQFNDNFQDARAHSSYSLMGKAPDPEKVVR